MVAVTKLIALLDKPALLGWANKIGLQGIDLKDYQKQSKDKGNDSHNKLERYFKEGIEFEGVELLKEQLKGFFIVGCELDVSNEHICGRVDLILKKDDQVFICDFKSNKNIYLGTKLQLSTYKHIYGADKICFINVDNYKIVEIDIKTEYYYEIVKRLYQVYGLIKLLNERL